MGAGFADGLSDGLAFVAAEIIEHDDVAGPQGRDEELLDIGAEPLAVDGPVEDAGCVDAVDPERSEEGEGAPAAMWRLADQALPAAAPTSERSHIGLRPSLVDEDQTFGVDVGLMRLPAGASPGDVRAVLFASERGFF